VEKSPPHRGGCTGWAVRRNIRQQKELHIKARIMVVAVGLVKQGKAVEAHGW